MFKIQRLERNVAHIRQHSIVSARETRQKLPLLQSYLGAVAVFMGQTCKRIIRTTATDRQPFFGMSGTVIYLAGKQAHQSRFRFGKKSSVAGKILRRRGNQLFFEILQLKMFGFYLFEQFLAGLRLRENAVAENQKRGDYE